MQTLPAASRLRTGLEPRPDEGNRGFSWKGPEAWKRTALWVAGGVLFTLVATANAAGYRYGVSDQAFYVPVIIRALDPSAFPRDAALIDAQGTLMLADEAIAGLIRLTGISLERLFLTTYLLSLAVIWAAIVLIGNRLYRHPLATVALGFAFTLRHRIPRTSANSFEPYFHPRMLAFGICLLAVAALLHRRPWAGVPLVAIAALVHVTTALWFAVMIGVAMLVLDARLRRFAVPGAIVAVVAGVTLVVAGPLRASLTRMDPVWLQAVASKDSLFPTRDWPAWAWLMNLGLLIVVWVTHRMRAARAVASPESAALAWGATALAALFVITLPLVAMQFALPVQLQISRVFWLIDFVATAFLVGALADTAPRRAAIVALFLVGIAAARGTYVMTVEQPDRALFAVGLPQTAWQDAMNWLRARPRSVHVLADPGHAWKYGTSVRVAAERDVFLEDVKDSAIAMYARPVAVRVVERAAALGDFSTLTDTRARDLAARYDIDYLVTETALPLPESYRNTQFHVYALRR